MSAPAGGPIFIVGAMGSGTTLLRLMLDSHEHLAIPPETGFMRAYGAHRFVPFKWSGRGWARRLGWSPRELDEQLGRFYETLFRRYADEQGKRRWGEKTPLHTWHVDRILRLFGDAVFVGIVRHPGGSIASNVGRWKQPTDVAVSHYRRYTRELVRQALRHPDRFVLVRYEELVLDPEPVLRALLEWLGEPWSDGVLRHHDVQARRGGRARAEGRTRVDDPVDAGRIARWTRTLDRGRRRRVARELSRLGAFLGYAMDDPAALAPLTAGSPLITAADLDARMAAFADLDLRRPERPAPTERPYDPRRVRLVPVRQPGPLRARVVAVLRRLPRPVREALFAVLRRRRAAR
jgi:hypothetical protein